METVNRCTVISSSDRAEPTHFGPAEMAGAYVVVVGVFPPGEPAPPLHLHPDTDEAFYLAEGEATFLLGDREVLARGGDLVFVPRGTAHTVWNSGAIPVHGLILISPGDAEHSFVTVDAA
jgi:mannose-6-phosphate isomerase-like protein (cupin superfamily)